MKKTSARLLIIIIAVSNVKTASAQSWKLTGNSGTSITTNFLGTTDNKPLIFRTNNIERMRLSKEGRIGLGIATPQAKLHVDGGDFLNLSTAGCFQIGSAAAANLGMDYNKIQTRNNGVASRLYLNYFGGDIWMGAHGGDPTPAIFVNADGRVGIGNSTVISGYALTVNASSTVPGSIYSSNDGNGDGIDAESFYGNGVFGYSTNAYGVYAYAANNNGLYAVTNNNVNYYAGFFDGDVYSTTGVYAGSDQKLKQNIHDFTSAMDMINKLQPKQYQFRHDGNYKLMNLPQGNHYGLIAQDVEKVLPDLVKNSKFDIDRATPVKHADPKDSSVQNYKKSGEIIDFKALNYTELIPIMIKGMQEQQHVNDKQQQQIQEQQQVNERLQEQLTELNQVVQSLSQNKNLSFTAPVAKTYLSQNIPNPFNNYTTINYILPRTYSSAKIIITDKSSNAIKEINLPAGRQGVSGTGQGSCEVDASTLASGAYQYSLYVDGKLINTKQMEHLK